MLAMCVIGAVVLSLRVINAVVFVNMAHCSCVMAQRSQLTAHGAWFMAMTWPWIGQ